VPNATLPDGARLAYDEYDFTAPWEPSEPVILLHGFSKNRLFWYGWIPGLAARYRVIRVDQRGHGDSSPVPDGFQMALRPFSQDLVDFLDALGLESAHFVMAEFTSTVAIDFANAFGPRIRSLTLPDTVMLDRFYMKKLGVTHLGQTVEIRNIRARVVGFTKGIRTFTTSPLIFTSYKNAQKYSALDSDKTMYLLVKAAPGVDLVRLRGNLQAAMDNVDVLPTKEFSRRTNFYWMFGTGAGLTVIIAAVLGLIVGIVVVAQTIYAATVDHIREFGTLKAMGATNGYIYRIILNQAVVSAIAGYAVAIVIASAVEYSSRGGGANIVLPASVRAGLFGLTLFMCVSAALVSINKVTKIDPALVFKG